MKASANGALNFSVLDGWWCEGYETDTGWAIGSGEEYDDPDEQDSIESRALYDTLEKEIVPLFYDRGKDDMPRGWIKMMKASLSKLNIFFNTNRMVRSYSTSFYLPCARRIESLRQDDRARLKELSAWKKGIDSNWSSVAVVDVQTTVGDNLKVGDMLSVTAYVRGTGLQPEDLKVELYFGAIDSHDTLVEGEPASMSYDRTEEDMMVFTGAIPLVESGRHGFAVRAMPTNPDLFDRVEPGMVVWS